MNNKVIPAVCVALLLAVSFCLCVRAGRAQVAGPPPAVAFPAILQPATPPEALEMWRASENNPAALLPYLDRPGLIKTLRKRGVPEGGSYDGPPSGVLYEAEVLRSMAVHRMGDIGGPDNIAALERFAAQSETEKDESGALVARLAVERIRVRQRGRDAYVREMLSWLETPVPPPSTTNRQITEAAFRVPEASRALGVIGAAEAVPLLLAKYEKADRKANRDMRFVGVPVFVRLGDTRGLEVLHDYLQGFAHRRNYFPLEPGQPDVAWAYWKMRTRGLSETAAAREILGATKWDLSALRGDAVLEMLGKPAVPALVAVLTNPPKGRDAEEQAQFVAARVLGSLRAREAVGALRKTLRANKSRHVRGMAGRALGQVGDKAAVPDLIAAVTAEREDTARFDILGALGKLADPRAETVLLQIAAQDANQNIRYVALKALRSAGTAGAIPILEARLPKEPDENVRAEIGFTIRKLKGE